MGVLALSGWDWVLVVGAAVALALIVLRKVRGQAEPDPVEEEPKDKGFLSGLLDAILSIFLR